MCITCVPLAEYRFVVKCFRLMSEQLLLGSQVSWFYVDPEMGQAGSSDLLPEDSVRKITRIKEQNNLCLCVTGQRDSVQYQK